MNDFIKTVIDILSVIAFVIIILVVIKTYRPTPPPKLIWEYATFDSNLGIMFKTFSLDTANESVGTFERVVKRPYGGTHAWREL